MKISGHKTAAMERRYNMCDDEDLMMAKHLMEEMRARRKNAAVS
jgi:hypothetical protein